MTNVFKISAIALACSAAAISAPAFAADTIGGFTLDSGTFGTGYGVHSDGTQGVANDTTSLDANVNQDGSWVTFSSSNFLKMTGSGEATVYPKTGSLEDLTVLFEKGWNYITFDFESGSNGTFTMLVNGTAMFDGCSLCSLSANGANKFVLSGQGITSLQFSFDPGIDTAKQFRVEGLSMTGVPEASTWAMMILGVGAIGGALRRRQKTSVNYSFA
jgi:hypothetical protein